jgi:hypothetical protein
MAFDAARGVTVLFGGYDGSNSNGETWEWNGAAWSQRLVSGPSPRANHAMAYDSRRGVTILSGGESIGVNGSFPIYSNETWEWNGTVWTQRMIGGPSPRAAHAMAYDASRAVSVLFGGVFQSRGGGPVFNDETWWLGANACPADLNGDGLVDDADFTIFMGAYNLLDCADPSMPLNCPSDLNGDGVVDDADFVIFVNAYRAMVCP